MFPIESGGEVPGVFLVEGIADHSFPCSIGSALLEVVTIGNSIIIVAGATSLLRAVGRFAVHSERTSIEPLQSNLFVRRSLREDPSRINGTEKKRNESYKKDHYNSFQRFFTSSHNSSPAKRKTPCPFLSHETGHIPYYENLSPIARHNCFIIVSV
jgi:hypothetical protein